MWAEPEQTQDMTAHASAVYNRLLLRYSEKHNGRLLNDEEVSQLLSAKMQLHVPGSTIRQYRNGNRFRLQFYMAVSQLFGVPLTSFLMDDADRRIDLENAISQEYVVLRNIENQQVCTAVAKNIAATRGLSESTSALPVTVHNNQTKTLDNGQLALIDTDISNVTTAGDYAISYKQSVIIIPVDGDGVMRWLDGRNEALATQPYPILGKVIGTLF
jgi:hypothetical protein